MQQRTDPSSYFVAGGRLAMVILVVFSYPLQAHPCRASLDKVLAWASPSSRGFKNPPPPSPFKYFAMTTTILILSYVVAITISELDLVKRKVIIILLDLMFINNFSIGIVICWFNWIYNNILHFTWFILLQDS